jgi:hypothetical protein
MRSYFLIVIIILMRLGAQAQTEFDVLKDKESEQAIFKGIITFQDLKEESSFDWLKEGYNAYKPDTNDIKYLSAQLPKFRMVVFIGTWCSDSHDMLPRMEKVLDMCSYSMSLYRMYGVDREKTTNQGEHKLYKITNVPTIILMDSETEIGRITETVKKSVEADLVNMIKTYLPFMRLNETRIK